MSRHKLKKFQEYAQFACALDWKTDDVKSRLHEFLTKTSKLTLELGCGRGEYTIALAQKYPKQQFIGIDYQSERLWHGAKFATENKLENVLFLRAFIDNLADYFPKHSVSCIILPFPDPYPRDRDAKKRLTSERFLQTYKKVLVPSGSVFLKTDSKNLWEFSKEELASLKWKSVRSIPQELIEIETVYERKAKDLGRKIYMLSFGSTH